MDYRVSAGERASFKRCRRQWDFGSAQRQNLQSVDSPPVDLNQAVRDALAVYYYPGMWDWQSHIVLPLVRKAFMRTMAAAAPSPQRTADVDLGTDLLERYFAWAPSVDDFGPLKIETDVEALVPDIRELDRGLLTSDGRKVLYADRIALLAVDAADENWVVTHQVVSEWQDLESMLLDEALVASCWAWEETYLGMEIAGTIHNEILQSPPEVLAPVPTETRTGRPGRGGHDQNEPSGGGRSIPQLQRPERLGNRPASDGRVEQETAGVLRRTRVRRTRAEIETTRQQVGAEVLEMLDPDLRLYPTPSAEHCPHCVFIAPCLTMIEGADPTLDLASRFRQGPPAAEYEPRLGAGGGGGRRLAMPPPPPTAPPK
ncbi:MAG: hypothetical protein DLM58_00760 [Pseudonocardiales bacterium]|nr:MAG: hypothetical protein DLM58_00760 [Pseudonocardiales bacterium]